MDHPEQMTTHNMGKIHYWLDINNIAGLLLQHFVFSNIRAPLAHNGRTSDAGHQEIRKSPHP
jgi:hypothetical protein